MSVETTETWLRVRGCGFHVIAMPPMPPIAMESDNCSLFLTMLAEWSSYCNAIIIITCIDPHNSHVPNDLKIKCL